MGVELREDVFIEGTIVILKQILGRTVAGLGAALALAASAQTVTVVEYCQQALDASLCHWSLKRAIGA